MNTLKAEISSKKRILVFPFNLMSHYLRCIVLINKYYSKDEYEVLFLDSPQFNSYIHRHDYNTFKAEQFDARKVMECAAKFDFSWLNEQDIERVFLSQANAIEKYKPYLVIGDTAPALKMAAEINGVEYIALMNGYMTKYYAYTRKLSITHKAYKYSQKVPEKYFDKITEFAENLSFGVVHKPFRKLRKKYGLKKFKSYLDEMEADKNLVCDLPELFPQKELPAHYALIPSLFYNDQSSEEALIKQIPTNKPLICICMGSTGDWESLRFLNDPYYSRYTILTAADTNRVLHADHIIARDFVNLNQVLDKAKLLICHGGNGTIYYGLLKGLYMFCISSHFEQEWNIHALQRIGYGISANEFKAQDWPGKIEEAIHYTLKPFFTNTF